MPYHLHIQADTVDDVEKELKELAYIMTGLRKWQKKWKDEYGANNRYNMQKWEAKADAWIEKHKTII